MQTQMRPRGWRERVRARERKQERRCSLEHDGAHGPEEETDVKSIITIKWDIYVYLTIATRIECCESGHGSQGERALQVGGTVGEAQSGEFPPRESGLKTLPEEKVLVERRHAHVPVGLSRHDGSLLPKAPLAWPSFLKHHTVSAENTPSMYFNKSVSHSHRGNWFWHLKTS